MTFTVGFKAQFASEFTRLKRDQQLRVAGFIKLYQAHGLGNFSAFPGKVAPSWSGLQTTDPNYVFASSNSLWHYHVGLPSYRQTHPKYMTSDWLLHFQWIGQGDHIDLVDLYQHYTWNGKFYLPGAGRLGQQPTGQP